MTPAKIAELANRYAKFLAAVLGAVTEALNLGLIPADAQKYVTIAISILTALGVHAVPNAPAPAAVAEKEAAAARLDTALGTFGKVATVPGVISDPHLGLSTGPKSVWPDPEPPSA